MCSTKIDLDDTGQAQFDIGLNSPFTFAEYFAGIGLVRLGLERAGWKVVFANDFDANKYEMYANYFTNAEEHYLVEDIFTIAPESVPESVLATSSFPCVDLSLAGNMNGLDGRHSSAFWGFVQILEGQGDKRPPLIMLENVPGWLSSNRGQDFRTTISALNRLGYAFDVFNLDARHFTPQSRRRVFAIGVQTDCPNGKLERLFARDSALGSNSLKAAVGANMDLAWDINHIPNPPKIWKSGFAHMAERLSEDDSRWWSEDQVSRHLDMMNRRHLQRVAALRKSNNVHYRTFYRRRRDGVQRVEVRQTDTAGCLRTARGGSSRQMVIVAGRDRVRMRHMTPREYARLQGVPDSYPLPDNTIQALTGFGDAVCVPAITWIAENVLEPVMMETVREGEILMPSLFDSDKSIP